ncbi:MAG: copper amine oxidase N-terminal domain-containing protein [Clostridia bacterium]|nr:copper amine oxidase N-terminal domain-containing protein [Clostridia bacterium]
MFKCFKIFSVVFVLLLLIHSMAFAAPAKTGNDISNEFEEDSTSLDDSVLLDNTSVDANKPATLQDVFDLIKSDPSNQEHYKLAAEQMAKNNEKGIKVFCDGATIDFGKYDNVEPLIADGRTMVPVRALAESLGATVGWDPGKRLITITLDEKVINLTLDSAEAFVSGNKIKLDVPAKAINGRTMIPLRFVSENMDRKVNWHPYSKELNIISIYDSFE